MIKRARKKHSGTFKVKVALEAVKAERTLNELCSLARFFVELFPNLVVETGSSYRVDMLDINAITRGGTAFSAGHV